MGNEVGTSIFTVHARNVQLAFVNSTYRDQMDVRADRLPLVGDVTELHQVFSSVAKTMSRLYKRLQETPPICRIRQRLMPYACMGRYRDQHLRSLTEVLRATRKRCLHMYLKWLKAFTHRHGLVYYLGVSTCLFVTPNKILWLR